MPLALNAALDRPLVRATAPSERYLLLTLQTPAGAAPRLPLNLALVIDRSGSMTGEKLARAREAASFVVRHLTSVDRVSVVAYDDTVTVVAPGTALTPQAKTDLLARIARIESGGSTNLSGGWLTGCQEVARHQSEVGDRMLHRTLLLTDGLANVGITRVEELVEHARQLRQRGIVTSTMGIGLDFDEELLEAMARHGGGRFQYVESARHIPDCVQGELGELLQVSVRKVAVEVYLPAGVQVVDCLNDLPREPLANGVRLLLGDLVAGDTRPVVLKLAVAPSPIGAERTVRALALSVDGATGHGTETAFPEVTLRSADQEAVDGQPTEAEVAREVALLLAARAKEEAVRLSRQGEHAGAATALRGALGLLAAAGPADAVLAAEAARLELLAEEAARGLTGAQLKELHYQKYLAHERRRRYGPGGRDLA